MRHLLQAIWMDKSFLDPHTAIQVLDYTQKPSVTRLEIRIVWHQSTVSCLQATMVISSQRIHIPLQTTLGRRVSHRWVTFSEMAHTLVVSHQYLHTPWSREQPTHMIHNDLYSIHNHLITTYHLVTNQFKNYMINSLFITNKIVLRTLSHNSSL